MKQSFFIKKTTIWLFSFFAVLNLAAQNNNCSILNGVSMDATKMTSESIENEIKKAGLTFTDVQIAELNLLIKKCNNSIDHNIAQLKSELQNYSNIRQDYLKIEDIGGIKKQIEEKKKGIGKIKEQILKDLEGVSIKSVYISFLGEINPFTDSPESCQQKTDALIASRVISETSPSFIESITELRDAVLNTDFITSKVSGTMTLDKRLLSSVNSQARHFVSLSKFSVAPLKKDDSLNSRNQQNGTVNFMMINPLIDSDYESKLVTKGVSGQLISSIKAEIESIMPTVKSENQYSINREKQILTKGKNNIVDLQKEIEILETNLRNRDKKIEEYFQNNKTLSFNSQNMDVNLQTILSDLDKKMENLKTVMKVEKEKELIGQIDIKVPFEGVPVRDIAKKAMDVYSSLKAAYSRVERFYEELKSQDGKTIDFQQKKSQDLYRVPEKVWIYPIPLQDNEFKLAVIIKFKVTDMIPSKSYIEMDNGNDELKRKLELDNKQKEDELKELKRRLEIENKQKEVELAELKRKIDIEKQRKDEIENQNKINKEILEKEEFEKTNKCYVYNVRSDDAPDTDHTLLYFDYKAPDFVKELRFNIYYYNGNVPLKDKDGYYQIGGYVAFSTGVYSNGSRSIELGVGLSNRKEYNVLIDMPYSQIFESTPHDTPITFRFEAIDCTDPENQRVIPTIWN